MADDIKTKINEVVAFLQSEQERAGATGNEKAFAKRSEEAIKRLTKEFGGERLLDDYIHAMESLKKSQLDIRRGDHVSPSDLKRQQDSVKTLMEDLRDMAGLDATAIMVGVDKKISRDIANDLAKRPIAYDAKEGKRRVDALINDLKNPKDPRDRNFFEPLAKAAEAFRKGADGKDDPRDVKLLSDYIVAKENLHKLTDLDHPVSRKDAQALVDREMILREKIEERAKEKNVSADDIISGIGQHQLNKSEAKARGAQEEKSVQVDTGQSQQLQQRGAEVASTLVAQTKALGGFITKLAGKALEVSLPPEEVLAPLNKAMELQAQQRNPQAVAGNQVAAVPAAHKMDEPQVLQVAEARTNINKVIEGLKMEQKGESEGNRKYIQQEIDSINAYTKSDQNAQLLGTYIATVSEAEKLRKSKPNDRDAARQVRQLETQAYKLTESMGDDGSRIAHGVHITIIRSQANAGTQQQPQRASPPPGNATQRIQERFKQMEADINSITGDANRRIDADAARAQESIRRMNGLLNRLRPKQAKPRAAQGKAGDQAAANHHDIGTEVSPEAAKEKLAAIPGREAKTVNAPVATAGGPGKTQQINMA